MTAADDPLLDRARIQDLFRMLGERLLSRGVVGEFYVVGGAAMALAYDARRATRDIDAVFMPHGIVLEEAQRLAEELGLPRSWLNDRASVFMAPGGDRQAPQSFDHPGLRVLTASPDHLLAMKAIAARRRDTQDLRLLVTMLGLHTADEVVALCHRIFPDEALSERSRLVLADIFDEIEREKEAE
jgi:predicted nucleotidyltransferase